MTAANDRTTQNDSQLIKLVIPGHRINIPAAVSTGEQPFRNSTDGFWMEF
jgi:hypothetical protein